MINSLTELDQAEIDWITMGLPDDLQAARAVMGDAEIDVSVVFIEI